MPVLEDFKTAHEAIKEKLKTVVLPDGIETKTLKEIADSLDITAPTVKNYLNGDIKDGYLAEAIYSEFKRLKMVKRK
jgi:predicted transcriptional regulator